VSRGGGIPTAGHGQRRARRGERGQGLVEFALLVPVLLGMLWGMLEFGTAFNHQLTLGYAVREGARIGADMVNGGGTLGCGSGQSPNAANVDGVIIEAIDRVLSSSGSPVPESRVSRIRIFQANTTGSDTLGFDDDWVYSATPYTLPDGTVVNFQPGATQAWAPCTRSNVLGHTTAFSPAQIDSIGVSIAYTYTMLTPIGSTLPMTDVAVMQFNPTSVSG
jgi:hypothetical protein